MAVGSLGASLVRTEAHALHFRICRISSDYLLREGYSSAFHFGIGFKAILERLPDAGMSGVGLSWSSCRLHPPQIDQVLSLSTQEPDSERFGSCKVRH